MTVLEFIAAVVRALAWPVVILALVLMFRRQLTDLIGRLKSAKWGDKEAVFDTIAEEFQDKLDEVARERALDTRGNAGGETVPPAELEPVDGSYPPDPERGVRSRWARDPQELYEKALSRWRHPSRFGPLIRRGEDLAKHHNDFRTAVVDPPRFAWYFDPQRLTESANDAFMDLRNWVGLTAALLGFDQPQDVKGSLVFLAELASLDETSLLGAWRRLVTMSRLIQAMPEDKALADEVARFVRSVEQFAQTLLEAVAPGLEVMRIGFEDAQEKMGEAQVVQQEAGRALDEW